jgi:hypothetical protein
MKIAIGKLVENKTLNYLFPILKVYGSTFLAKFNLTHKLAYGIHDCVLDGTPFEDQRKICMLIDRKNRPNLYEDFIRWIRLQDYYITDYSHDDNITGRMQMVLIEVPETYSKVYDNFLESKYSKMYSNNDIDTFFKKNTYEDSHPRQVLMKSSEIAPNFVKKVNEIYGTTLTVEDFDKEGEYDFPWEKQNEFFNYRENKEEAL